MEDCIVLLDYCNNYSLHKMNHLICAYYWFNIATVGYILLQWHWMKNSIEQLIGFPRMRFFSFRDPFLDVISVKFLKRWSWNIHMITRLSYENNIVYVKCLKLPFCYVLFRSLFYEWLENYCWKPLFNLWANHALACGLVYPTNIWEIFVSLSWSKIDVDLCFSLSTAKRVVLIRFETT